MAQTAYAYQQPRRREEEPQRAPLRSLPGKQSQEQAQPLSRSVIKTAAISAAVSLLLLMGIGVFNVAVTNSTRALMTEAQDVEDTIIKIRNDRHTLLKDNSIAKRPERIKELASQHQMTIDTNVITLPVAAGFTPEVQAALEEKRVKRQEALTKPVAPAVAPAAFTVPGAVVENALQAATGQLDATTAVAHQAESGGDGQ